MQHRNVGTACDKTWQCGWKLAGDFISIVLVWEAPKHTSSSAGQSCWNKFVQQDQCVTYSWVTLLDDRLAVITTTPLKKAANFNGRRIACQLAIGENFCCADKHLRYGNEKPGLGQLDRCEFLTDAFGECGAAAHEYRHVRAQAQAQRCQAIFTPVQLPEVSEAEQGGGRIRAAAAYTAAHRQAFVQPDIGAQPRAAVFLQLPRCVYDQVGVVRYAVDLGVQADNAIIALAEPKLVTVVKKLEQGLQFVITVIAPAEDMQHQIQFGRSGQDEFGVSRYGVGHGSNGWRGEIRGSAG